MADPAEKADFVGLLTSHQRRLYGYIATLLPNPADCEEVLQQTNLVLWARQASFEPGTSFRAWAFRVAQLEVIGFRRRRSLERRVFSDQLVEIMAGEVADRESASLESRIAALHRCLAKLPDTDRQLIDRRYWETANVRQMADELDRPASSVYRSLDRIRYALLECIQEALAAEEQKWALRSLRAKLPGWPAPPSMEALPTTIWIGSNRCCLQTQTRGNSTIA